MTGPLRFVPMSRIDSLLLLVDAVVLVREDGATQSILLPVDLRALPSSQFAAIAFCMVQAQVQKKSCAFLRES